MDTIQSNESIDWLVARGITADTMSKNHITASKDGTIVIPIMDESGRVSFNKYRRSPSETEGPKYRYDTGAKVQLYGVHNQMGQMVVLCEGELDALLVQSLGISALSTTGGSQSFKDEWVPQHLRGKNVYVCYDNDDAGLKGAMKVLPLIPSAQMVFIPRSKDVKDITDYVKKFGTTEFIKLLYAAKPYQLPDDSFVEPTSKGFERAAKEARGLAEIYQEKVNEAKGDRKPFEHLDAMRELCLHKYDYYTEEAMRLKRTRTAIKESDVLSLEEARQVPIKSLIKISRGNVARCLWHDEKSASMHYYPIDNHLYCFGCNKRADSIDVVMQRDGLDFKQALQFLTNSHG